MSTSSTCRRGRHSDSLRRLTATCWAMSPEGRSRPDEDDVQAVMQRFVRDFPDAVLIGGWATYLRTRVAKSHDIDIIVDHATLAKLRAKFQLSPSHHISGRKFELNVEGVGVDVYPAYQSKLGQRLQIPVEVLMNYTENIDRTRILTTEAQFVAKMAALLDRPDTLPGEKDRREVWGLINSGPGVNFNVVAGILGAGGWGGARRSEARAPTLCPPGETGKLDRQDTGPLKPNCT